MKKLTKYALLFHVSCSNISELRKKHKDAFFKKHGVKLGFMSAFIRASAHALQSEPTVNAGQLVCISLVSFVVRWSLLIHKIKTNNTICYKTVEFVIIF